MHWTLVPIEKDTDAIGRSKEAPLTSPKYEDLSERAKEQVDKVMKLIQLSCKSELVGSGAVRVNASGYAHHDAEKMPVGDKDFIAISIGRMN